jgi:hypothetical protein
MPFHVAVMGASRSAVAARQMAPMPLQTMIAQLIVKPIVARADGTVCRAVGSGQQRNDAGGGTGDSR